MTPAPISQRLSVEQAAAYTGLSVSTLNKYRCTGAGPKFIKPGGARRVVYDSADIDAWLAEHRHLSTAELVAASRTRRKP